MHLENSSSNNNQRQSSGFKNSSQNQSNSHHGYQQSGGYGNNSGYGNNQGYDNYGAPIDNKKVAAGLLGIFLGPWGVHKFYLGYTTEGIIQILITLFSCGALGILGVIEGIVYLTKSDEEFYYTYQVNKKGWF